MYIIHIDLYVKIILILVSDFVIRIILLMWTLLISIPQRQMGHCKQSALCEPFKKEHFFSIQVMPFN